MRQWSGNLSAQKAAISSLDVYQLSQRKIRSIRRHRQLLRNAPDNLNLGTRLVIQHHRVVQRESIAGQHHANCLMPVIVALFFKVATCGNTPLHRGCSACDEGAVCEAIVSSTMQKNGLSAFCGIRGKPYQQPAFLNDRSTSRLSHFPSFRKWATEVLCFSLKYFVLATVNEQIVKTAQGTSKKENCSVTNHNLSRITKRLVESRFCAFFRICSFIVGYFPVIAGHENRMDDCHYVFQVYIGQNFSEPQLVQTLANFFRFLFTMYS